MKPCTLILPSSRVPVALSQMPGFGSLVLQLHFDVGAVDETPSEYGLAHLVEHLVLNATPSFPTPNGVGRAFRSRGGWLNGCTTQFGLSLIARVPADEAQFAATVLAEAATQPLFAAATFASEQRAVIAELDTQTDNFQRLYDGLCARLEPNTALGRPTGGTPADVQQLTLEAATAFYQRFFAADRMRVTAAGRIPDPDLFLARLDAQLAPLARRRSPQRAALAPAAPDPQTLGPAAALLDTETGDDCAVLVAFHGPGYRDNPQELLALEAATDFFASGDDCHLMDVLRWQRGLIYDVHYDIERFPQRSLFQIGFSCPRASLEPCWKILQQQLARAAAQIPATWADEWKRRRRGRLICTGDDPELQVDRLLFDLLARGQARDLPTILHEVEAVTPSEVHAAARRYLVPERMAFGVACSADDD